MQELLNMQQQLSLKGHVKVTSYDSRVKNRKRREGEALLTPEYICDQTENHNMVFNTVPLNSLMMLHLLGGVPYMGLANHLNTNTNNHLVDSGSEYKDSESNFGINSYYNTFMYHVTNGVGTAYTNDDANVGLVGGDLVSLPTNYNLFPDMTTLNPFRLLLLSDLATAPAAGENTVPTCNVIQAVGTQSFSNGHSTLVNTPTNFSTNPGANTQSLELVYFFGTGSANGTINSVHFAQNYTTGSAQGSRSQLAGTVTKNNTQYLVVNYTFSATLNS